MLPYLKKELPNSKIILRQKTREQFRYFFSFWKLTVATFLCVPKKMASTLSTLPKTVKVKPSKAAKASRCYRRIGKGMRKVVGLVVLLEKDYCTSPPPENKRLTKMRLKFFVPFFCLGGCNKRSSRQVLRLTNDFGHWLKDQIKVCDNIFC